MSPEKARPETILIVEDDAGIAELEQMQLERAGFSVLAAGTRDETLAQLRRHAVDLVLLDYRLPGNVDGLDLYAQMKAAGFDLPVILVTGFSNESLAIQALRAGVRDFVTKSPEYLDYLPEAVQRVMKQVRTERQLAESEARLTSIIDSAKDAIIIAEADQRISLFNQAAEAMFRCPASQALGQRVSRFIPRKVQSDGPETDVLHPEESLTRLIQFGNRGLRADGAVFPLEASLSRAQVGGRKLYIVIVRDVTERNRAEAALDQQRLRLEGILNSAMDGIITIDEDQRIIVFNAAAEGMFRCRADAVLGQSIEQCIPQRFRARHADHVREFGRTGVTSRAMGQFGPISGLRANGEEFPIEASISQIQLEGRTFFTVTCRDVTERAQAEEARQKLEAQLHQSQKMEAFGQLAAGVAHDFNNLLTVISGFSDILLSTLPPTDPKREALRAISDAGSRAASLTRQLLAFSRQTVLEPKVLDLNEVVRETEKMLRRLIGEDILLTAVLDPTIRRVKVDPGQLGQVLMNLAVNARDAMPKGGKITVETGNVELDESYAKTHPEVRAGSYVMLAISDTGHGMTPEVKARIFEPFFTTKGVGKGTGLGLAVVHGIARQSGGHVAVYSEPDIGTTFKVYLPAVDEQVHAAKELGSSSGLGGTETILLVEDEDGVRGLALFVLQSHGYTVLTAGDGKEALRVVEKHRGDIDLLATDVVMPNMDGPDLAKILGQQFPRMKVLYMSGYTDDSVVRHGVLQAEVAFLQKPYSPHALARKVRQVLGEQ